MSLPAQKNIVRLGSLSDLTGPYEKASQSQMNGVALAVEKINAQGGIGGRQIKQFVKDSALKPEIAKAGTHELIEVDKVDFIVGGLTASMHLAINDQTAKYKIPFISCGQSNDLTKAQHLGQYTFHQAITPYMNAQSMGQWVAENVGKKWFLFVPDYEWGWQIHESYQELAKRKGAEIVGLVKMPFPLKETDRYTPHFANIFERNPEVLIVNNFGKEQIQFIEEANAAGLKRKLSIVHTLSENSVMAKVDPDAAAGMYWGTTFYWGLQESLDTAREFVSDYMKHFHELPGAYAAYGYSGGMEMLGAAQRIGGYPINRDKITAELEGRTYAHYKTKEWWRPCDHQAFQDYYVLKAKGPEERKNPDDSSEIVGFTSWDLELERSCELLGHEKSLWGHVKAAYL